MNSRKHLEVKYPDFFNQVPSIQLYDPLADFLGAFENGIVEFSYIDAVKLAGHSCPTIAGAYMLTYKALNALYSDTIPLRGGVKIEFKESAIEGVIGVMANVMTQITGATKESGFKGINGNYVRHSLMEFEADIPGFVRFTRIDNGKSVNLNYNPTVPPEESQQMLMKKVVSKSATEAEKAEFKMMWQERVRKILIEHFKDPEVIVFI